MMKQSLQPCLSLPRSAFLGAVLLSASEANATTEKDYNIPAGPAAEMLGIFAEKSCRETLFSSEVVRGVRTAAVRGRFTAHDALQRMLLGTGLTSVMDEQTGALALRRDDSAAPKAAQARTGWFRVRALVAGIAAASVNVLAGQTVTPAATTEPATIVLSPFEVNASQDQGYLATNTLSGSRVNTPLYTTPSVTSVFTRDFLDDIAANDLVEVYAYGLNMEAQEQPGQSGNFRGNIFSDNAVNIRGLNAATARNYFVWSVNGDSYNLERLDFSRGPNNILFGLGGQGGVVNSTTKRAHIGRERTAVQARVGEWDLYRGQLDISRTFHDKFALRVNALVHEEGGWKNHAFFDRQGLHLAGTWEIFRSPTASTYLRADYENLKIDRAIGFKFPLKDQVGLWNGVGIPAGGSLAGVSGTANMPNNRRVYVQGRGDFFQSNGVRQTTGPSGTSFTDESIVPREASFSGPDNRNDSDVENFTLMLEQQVFTDLFIEVAYNRQSDRHRFTQVDGFDIYIDPRTTIGAGAAAQPNPYFGQHYADYTYGMTDNTTEVDEARLTVSYELDLGKFGRHQLAGLASRRENVNFGKNFSFDDVTLNSQVMFRRHIADGDGAEQTKFDPAAVAAAAAADGLDIGFRQGNLNHSESRQDTLQMVHVGSFFTGRLSTVIGLRKDELFNRNEVNGTSDSVTADPLFKRRREWNDFQRSPWTFADQDYTMTKGFTLGWSDSSPVRVYYNESESFVNQSGLVMLGLTERDESFPPRKGEGRDMGVRFRLLDDRIQGSVGYFDTQDVGARHFLHGAFGNSTRFAAVNVLGLSPADWRGWQDTVDLSSEGYEVEITANPTPNWRLHFNYARTNLETSNHGPTAKNLVLGQFFPEWRTWVDGWRLGADETGVNNTSPAVNVSQLGRPLTRTEAHGSGIDPRYTYGDRGDFPTVTGALGLEDWISRASWAGDIWFQDGMAPRRHRRDSFNLVSNYSFARESRFDGWTVGVGARWRGGAVLDRSFDQDGSLTEVIGNSRMDTDLTIGYTRRFEKFTFKAQLNVRNLLNTQRVEVVNVAGNADERGHLLWHDPRNVRLTVDFIF